MRRSDDGRGGDPIAFVETPKEVARLMASLVGADPGARLLDAGCGSGAILSELLAAGYEGSEGVEISPQLRDRCLERVEGARVHLADFLSWEPERRYQAIVSNPPYMHCNELPARQRELAASVNRGSDSNIYYAFIARGVDLIDTGGELVYIVPYNFFYNTHAGWLRRKLSLDGRIDLVIDLDEARIFEGENPEVVIFRYRKVRRGGAATVLRLRKRTAGVGRIESEARRALDEGEENDLFALHESSGFDSGVGRWSTYPAVEIPHYRLLGQVAEVAVGMLSGCSEAFALSESEYRALPESERNLALPFAKARHLKGFWAEGKEWKVVVGNAAGTESELKEKYPAVYSHLLKCKSDLRDRYLDGVRWFNWSALRNKRLFDEPGGPLILVPSLDRSPRPRFSLVEGGIYAEGDVTAVVPRSEDPFYLLAYLNSSLFRRYYLAHGARRGGRLAYTQSVLSSCRVPTFEREVERNLAELARRIWESGDASLSVELDEVAERAHRQGRYRRVGVTKFLS
jgi:adenine-specific DNA-methyltransferase